MSRANLGAGEQTIPQNAVDAYMDVSRDAAFCSKGKAIASKSFMGSPQVFHSLKSTRRPSIQICSGSGLTAALFERPFRAAADFDLEDPDLIADRAQGGVQQRDLFKRFGRQRPALRGQFFYRRKARRFEALSKVVNGGGISHRILPNY
jgi:hypothetical protein